MVTLINSLPNNKFLDCSKLKALADDKINVNENLKLVLGKVENCGKRRKCWLSAFSTFPSMFSKGFFYKVVKKSGLCGRGLNLYLSTKC